MDEFRRSMERNSVRNIVNIERRYVTIISGDIFVEGYKIHYVQFGKNFDI